MKTKLTLLLIGMLLICGLIISHDNNIRKEELSRIDLTNVYMDCLRGERWKN